MNPRKRQQTPPVKSDPELRAFVDALRACLDLEPIYDRSEARPSATERFYVQPRAE